MDPNVNSSEDKSLPPLPTGATNPPEPNVTVVQPTSTQTDTMPTAKVVDYDKKNLMNMAKWILVVVVGLALVFVIGTVISYVLDDGGKIANVRVTNVSANGATITWTTEKQVKGRVLWNTDNSWLPSIFKTYGENVAFDDRDLEQTNTGEYRVVAEGESNRETHHVTLRNLDPEKEYFFQVGNGSRYFDFETISFTTKKVLEELQTPEPFYGKINEPQNGETVDDGIVFYQIREKSGALSSSWYSIPLSETGTYSGDLGYLTDSSGNYFKADKTKSIFMEVLSEFGGVNVDYSLEEYQPLPGTPVDPAYVPLEGEVVGNYLNSKSKLIQTVQADGCRYYSCSNQIVDGQVVSGFCGTNYCSTSPSDPCGKGCGGGGGNQNPTTTPAPQAPPESSINPNTGNSVEVQNDCSGKNCGVGGTCYPGNNYDGGWGCRCSGGQDSGLGHPSSGYCTQQISQLSPDEADELNQQIDSNGGSPTQGRPEGASCSTKSDCAGAVQCINCGSAGMRCAGTHVTCGQIRDGLTGTPTPTPQPQPIVSESYINSISQLTEEDLNQMSEDWTNLAIGLVGNACNAGSCPSVSCGGSKLPPQVQTTATGVICKYKGGGTISFSTNGGQCNKSGGNGGSVCEAYEEARGDNIDNQVIFPIPPRDNTCSAIENSVLRDICQQLVDQKEQKDLNTSKTPTPTPTSGSGPNGPTPTGHTDDPDDVLGAQDDNILGANTDTIEPGVYQIGGGGLDSVTITITEDGLEIVFFLDENEDGIKQANEQEIELSSFSVALAKTESVVRYTTNNGWNLFGFEIVSNDWDKASELVAKMNINGTAVTHIATYSEGKWLMYSARVDEGGDVETFGDDFTILPGKGYFVKSLNSGSFDLSGRAFTESVPLSLANGWNLVSVQTPTSYNAEGLIDKCIAAAIGCDSLARFDSGLYEIVVKDQGTLFGNNFNLIKKSGYFLRVQDRGGKQLVP